MVPSFGPFQVPLPRQFSLFSGSVNGLHYASFLCRPLNGIRSLPFYTSRIDEGRRSGGQYRSRMSQKGNLHPFSYSPILSTRVIAEGNLCPIYHANSNKKRNPDLVVNMVNILTLLCGSTHTVHNVVSLYTYGRCPMKCKILFKIFEILPNIVQNGRNSQK